MNIPEVKNKRRVLRSIDQVRAGEYEVGILANSEYDEGDWNDDGEFDSGDVVLAFQAMNYLGAIVLPATSWATVVDAALTTKSHGASDT